MCHFTCQAQKTTNWVKSKIVAKMATMFGDITSTQQRHHPYIPHFDEKMKAFPLKVKSFQNTATYQKQGRGFINPPPPTLLVPC